MVIDNKPSSLPPPSHLPLFPPSSRGVLETLIRRHFPSPAAEPGLAGIDWSLIDNDPTLPRSCRRRRQRKKPVGQREETFGDSDSDASSDSPERSDSAVESSSDEGERSSEGSGSSSSESGDDEDNDINPFGSDFSGKFVFCCCFGEGGLLLSQQKIFKTKLLPKTDLSMYC